MAHDHHDHDDPHTAPLTETQLRVKALESLLTEKGLVDPRALDELIDTYETKVGPRNGAQVVARAWVDPAYRQRLLRDATSAIAEFGFTGRQGENMVALENTSDVHNMVTCTLCSCYPWPVLGLPPVWYKAAPYRAADRVQTALTRGGGARMDVDLPPRFKPGDRVRARNTHPLGHTRLPRYARGRARVIDRDHGVFVFADASGDGLGKIPQHVYAVRFTARELWGDTASPRDTVYIDLWDDHLDPA